MTVKLPEKAGFVATPDEWDALVRIAENLGAQVVKLRSDLSLARDEYSAADYDAHKWAALANEKANALDAARAEVARLTAENDFLNGGSQADKQEIDNLLAENERLTNVIGFIENELQMSIGVGPFWDVMHDVHLFRGSLIDLCLAQLPEALRQPAQAQGQE